MDRIRHSIPITSIDRSVAKTTTFHLNANFIDLEVYYSKGGTHIFSGRAFPRGYYLSASPVVRSIREGGFSSTAQTLGSGVKDCMIEVSRQSDKQMGIACSIAVDRAPLLLAWCNRKYGIQYDEPDTFFPDAAKLPIPKVLPKTTRKESAKPAPAEPPHTMKLLTAEIIRKLQAYPLGSQDGKGDDAEVLVKYFGGGACTWLITEGEKQEDGDWLLYGKASLGYEWEWGPVMLSELEALKFPPFGLSVERDLHITSGATVGDLSM